MKRGNPRDRLSSEGEKGVSAGSRRDLQSVGAPVGWGAVGRGVCSCGWTLNLRFVRRDPASQTLVHLFLAFQKKFLAVGTFFVTTRKYSSCGLFSHTRSSSLVKTLLKSGFSFFFRYPQKVMDKILSMAEGIKVTDAPIHTTRDELVAKVKKRGISSSNG